MRWSRGKRREMRRKMKRREEGRKEKSRVKKNGKCPYNLLVYVHTHVHKKIKVHHNMR